MIQIGVTMGDPKGIGPEIAVKAYKYFKDQGEVQIKIYGDKGVLQIASEMLDVSLDLKDIVITSNLNEEIGFISEPDAAKITLLALDAVIEDIKNKKIDALSTAPVNKYRMQLIDKKFIGHTEKLARATGTRDVVMMFASPFSSPLRISLATSHLALKDVSENLTKQKLLTTINITADALKRFWGCNNPRIAVLGLNPHSGEGGVLGKEEIEIIKPVIEHVRKEGITCFGPIAVEALFSNINKLDFDAVIAMYHDQGLIPMKIICPKEAVNITLGLPFIRTSPGHGTAEDIAWRNKADESSMLASIEMAQKLIECRR